MFIQQIQEDNFVSGCDNLVKRIYLYAEYESTGSLMVF